MERAHHTFMVPGGQAAIALIYLTYCQAGSHALVPFSAYGPNQAMAQGMLRRLGIEVEAYDPLLGGGIAEFIRPNTTLIWVESPWVTNHIAGRVLVDQIDPVHRLFTMPAGMAPASALVPGFGGDQCAVRCELHPRQIDAVLPPGPLFLNRYFELDLPTGTPSAMVSLLVNNGWFDSAGGLTNAGCPATPYVTGAVALYASLHPGANAAAIKQAILAATVPTPGLAGKTLTGGRLDVSGF